MRKNTSTTRALALRDNASNGPASWLEARRSRSRESSCPGTRTPVPKGRMANIAAHHKEEERDETDRKRPRARYGRSSVRNWAPTRGALVSLREYNENVGVLLFALMAYLLGLLTLRNEKTAFVAI